MKTKKKGAKQISRVQGEKDSSLKAARSLKYAIHTAGEAHYVILTCLGVVEGV